MRPVEHFVAQHRAECAQLDCTPSAPEWLWLAELLALPLAIAIALALFTLTGLSGKLSTWLERRQWRGFVLDGIYGAGMAVFVWLVCLPALYLKAFVLPQRSAITISGPLPEFAKRSLFEVRLDWFGDQVGLLLVLCAYVIIITPIALAIVRRIPRWYWLLPAAAFSVWTVSQTIKDEFYIIRPLPDSVLAADIAAIAEAGGVEADRIYVGEGFGPMTSPLEAHVTWHRGRQIAVLNETYLNTLPLPPERYAPRLRPVSAAEVRAVAAHEIAHLKHNHLVAFPLAISLAGFLAAFLAASAVRRIRHSVGSRETLPTILLAFGLAFALMMPVRANIIRHAEHQADATSLDIGRDPAGFADLAMRMGRGGLLDRREPSQTLLSTHPDSLDRIERAVEWSRSNEAAEWSAQGSSGRVRQRTAYGFDYFDWPD